MFPSLAVVAAFAVASVSAIAVTSPSASKGWTNDGSQIVSWSSVVSDPGNFTILLVVSLDLLGISGSLTGSLE
jgi:hypothetical protein